MCMYVLSPEMIREASSLNLIQLILWITKINFLINEGIILIQVTSVISTKIEIKLRHYPVTVDQNVGQVEAYKLNYFHDASRALMMM